MENRQVCTSSQLTLLDALSDLAPPVVTRLQRARPGCTMLMSPKLPSPSHAQEVEAAAPHTPSSSLSSPARIRKKAVPKAQGTGRPQRTLETKASKDIPHGALKGYMDIMDKLVRLALSAPGPSGGESEEDRKESQQEEDGTYLDPGLLSYIDKLCSQEDFVIKVGWLRALGSTGF